MLYAAKLLIIKLLDETTDTEVEPTSERTVYIVGLLNGTDTGLPVLKRFN